MVHHLKHICVNVFNSAVRGEYTLSGLELTEERAVRSP